MVASNDPHHPSVHSDLTGTGTLASGGSIQIALVANPNSGQDFAFSGSLSSFSLDDDADNALPNQQTTADLVAGDYTITQASVSTWALTDLVCGTAETIDATNRTVTVHLGAGENVTCTFTDTKRQPDGMIAKSLGGAYAGGNVYSSTPLTSQTKNRAIARGKTKTFFVQVQNDSLTSDSLSVSSILTGSTKFQVKFFQGSTDISARVNAGTYTTGTLASGAHVTITILVKAKLTTPASATRNIDLLITSRSASGSQDLVRAHVTRA